MKIDKRSCNKRVNQVLARDISRSVFLDHLTTAVENKCFWIYYRLSPLNFFKLYRFTFKWEIHYGVRWFEIDIKINFGHRSPLSIEVVHGLQQNCIIRLYVYYINIIIGMQLYNVLNIYGTKNPTNST